MADDSTRPLPFLAGRQMQYAFQLDGTRFTAIESDVVFGDHVIRPKGSLVFVEGKMRHHCTTVAVQAAQAILPRNPFAMSIVPHQVTGVNCLTVSAAHDTIYSLLHNLPMLMVE